MWYNDNINLILYQRSIWLPLNCCILLKSLRSFPPAGTQGFFKLGIGPLYPHVLVKLKATEMGQFLGIVVKLRVACVSAWTGMLNRVATDSGKQGK